MSLRALLAIASFAPAIFAGACGDTSPVGTEVNLRPATFIAFDTINTQLTSRVRAAWYGDDPDGFVTGYLYSWDKRSWYFTQRTDSVFTLSLEGASGSYTLSVIAVDNTAAALPPADTMVTVAFLDASGNGAYDAGEEFEGVTGATDLTPATLTYPIVNSAPEVFFGDDSTAAARLASRLPDTTFTVATVHFRGFDLDGDETIVRYEWSLNDSSSTADWKPLPPAARSLTLRLDDGLLPNALNRLFLRAFDAAGAVSRVASMPEDGGHWFVRMPRGRVLVIRDYALADAAAGFYFSAMESIDGGKFAGAWDILDIRRGAAGGAYGSLVPRIIDPMFVETLRLFDAIIWYGDNIPTIQLARIALPPYLRSGGHVLMTTALPSQIEPQGALLDFVPLDSAATFELPNPLPAGVKLVPQPLADGSYPAAEKGSGSIFLHPLFPGVTAQPLYRLSINPMVPGEPVMAVRSEDRSVAFFAFQLHKIAAPGASQIIERTLRDFGL